VSFPPRYAVLMDGAFLLRKLQESLRAFPTADQVEAIATSIAAHDCIKGLDRLRVYFCHARPATGRLINPISKLAVNLGTTPVYASHESLIDTLELRPDFALRLGETNTAGWKLGDRAFTSLMGKPRNIVAIDLVPNIEQKGVDLRIGLDIARLALTQSVQAIVACTGDSDLIPAFKFARREGLPVFLCHFGHGVKRELKAHADRVIDIKMPKPSPATVPAPKKKTP
jgi:uncharacterized LabA/DUF88 family protein